MNNLKHLFFAVSVSLLTCGTMVCHAQEAEDAATPRLTQFSLETRLGYEYDNVDGSVVDNNTGFKGQFLNLRIDGEIVKGLSFSYRQRLNKNTNATFFDATDWLHLDWKATDKLTLSGGKQVVAIGGYEYDKAPIDLYYCSEFWNNIPCYQIGVSAAYNVSAKDQVMLQISNSPFRNWAGNNTYAFNLAWYGNHGVWENIWSTNLMQYGNGKWINYIALGNRFNITDGLHLDVDFMNRAADHQGFLFKDCSVMTELSYQPTESLRCFGKYTYDHNHSGTGADLLILDGTKINLATAGVEYCPLKNYRNGLRLFAAGGYSWGDNSNTDGTMKDKQLRLEAGVKFKLDVLDALAKVLKK